MQQLHCINQREAKKRGVIDRVGYAQGYAQGIREGEAKGRAEAIEECINNINGYVDMLLSALNDRNENPILHDALASVRADEIRIRKLIVEQLKERQNEH